MKIAPLPPNEKERLATLRDYEVLDTELEAAFDQLVFLASKICETPISVVSLVDEHRQWFKARHGLDATETGRDVAFCSHAILLKDGLSVPNALADERFFDNPLVTGGPKIRAYSGVPLVSPGGLPLGTLCVIDSKPREFTLEQRESLRVIASQVMMQLELRRIKAKILPAFSHEGGVMAALSHELRTPLNGLLGASELLLETELTPEQKAWVEMSRRSATSLLAMVDQLLAMGNEVAKSGLGK